jgi:hypothetical protein
LRRFIKLYVSTGNDLGELLEVLNPKIVLKFTQTSRAVLRLNPCVAAVSREYLHRYLWQFHFLWNNRQLNDGERTILAVKAAEGKRLMYKDPVAEREHIKTREQKKGGEHLEPF